MKRIGLVIGLAPVGLACALFAAACSSAEASDGAGGDGGENARPLELTCIQNSFEDQVIECREVQREGSGDSSFFVRYAEFDFDEGDEITVCTAEVSTFADQRANRSRCTRSKPSYYADSGQGYVKCQEGFAPPSSVPPDPASIMLHRRVVAQGPCCETCPEGDAECDAACIPFNQSP